MSFPDFQSLVQLTEYSLVILVSMLFVGASVATYGAYAVFESKTEATAAFSTLVTLASHAIEDGSSLSRVLFPTSSISCAAGVLTLRSPHFVGSQALPVRCAFAFDVLAGLHTVKFVSSSEVLRLMVL